MRFRKPTLGAGLLRAGFVGALVGVPLAVFPAGYNPFGPVKLLVLAASATAVCVGLAIEPRAADRVRRALAQPLGMWLAALVTLFVLAAALATDARAAIAGVYPGYEAGILALGAMLVTGFAGAVALPRASIILARSLTVALLIVGLIALVEWAFEGGGVFAARLGATLGNASNLGLWCAIALPWATRAFLAKESRAWRIVSAAAIVSGVICVVLSGSRGAALAVLAQLVTGAVLAHRFDPVRTRRAVIVLALVSAAMLALLVGQSTGGARQDVPDTATGRLDTWRSTAPLILSRPFLGYGPAGFGRAFAATAQIPVTDTLGRDRPLEDPHNVLLSTAVSAGPVAALCLLGLAWSAGAIAWRASRTDADVLLASASAVAGFVGLQFHFMTLDAGPALFGSLGVLAAAGVLSREEPAVSSAGEGVDAAGRRVHAIVAAVLAFCYLGATMAAFGIVSADATLRQGLSAAASDWPVAEARLARARSYAPWDPTFAWATGRAARDAVPGAHGERALRVGERALADANAMRPGDHRIARDMGDLYAAAAFTRQSDPESLERATRSYDEALRLAPTDALNWLGRGSVRLAAGRFDEAVSDLTRAIELSPRITVAWENLASAKGAAGDVQGAREARERAVELKAGQSEQ